MLTSGKVWRWHWCLGVLITLTWLSAALALPRSTPITVKLQLSHVPNLHEEATLTIEVQSILDAPDTSVELLLPEGAIAQTISWVVDLQAHIPITLTTEIVFHQPDNLMVSARAFKTIDSEAVLGDMQTISLHIGPTEEAPMDDAPPDLATKYPEAAVAADRARGESAFAQVVSALSGNNFTAPYLDEWGNQILKPHTRSQEALVICLDLNQPNRPMMSLNQIQAVMKGVADWYGENSLGRFGLSFHYRGCGGDTGRYVSSQVPGPNGERDHGRDYTDAIQFANSSIDYASYDRNRDGHLSGDELAIVLVRPHPANWGNAGFARWATANVDGISTALVSDAWFEAAADNTDRIGVVAHELAHNMLNAGDLYDLSYGIPDLRWDADFYSLMDSHSRATHMDPFHKLKYGWLNARTLPLKSTTFTLYDVETTGDAMILYDESRGTSEYFIVEYREPGNTFDVNLPAGGVVVWLVIEDHATARASAQNGAEKYGWGRYAIRRLDQNSPLQVSHNGTMGYQWLYFGFGHPSLNVRVERMGNGSATVTVEPPPVYSWFTSTTAGNWTRFSPIWVPAGKTFKAVLAGADPDADLFVRKDGEPDQSNHDCLSVSYTSNESCQVDTGAGGWFYIGLYGYSGNPSLHLTAHY